MKVQRSEREKNLLVVLVRWEQITCSFEVCQQEDQRESWGCEVCRIMFPLSAMKTCALHFLIFQRLDFKIKKGAAVFLAELQNWTIVSSQTENTTVYSTARSSGWAPSERLRANKDEILWVSVTAAKGQYGVSVCLIQHDDEEVQESIKTPSHFYFTPKKPPGERGEEVGGGKGGGGVRRRFKIYSLQHRLQLPPLHSCPTAPGQCGPSEWSALYVFTSLIRTPPGGGELSNIWKRHVQLRPQRLRLVCPTEVWPLVQRLTFITSGVKHKGCRPEQARLKVNSGLCLDLFTELLTVDL